MLKKFLLTLFLICSLISNCFAAVDDSNTKLLLHCDGADGSQTFTDEAGGTVTANGNAQIDDAQYKWNQSGLFDGTGDALTVTDAPWMDIGTGNFTVDFWVRFNASPYDQDFVAINALSSTTNGLLIAAQDPTNLYVSIGATDYNASFTWASNTWYHIAVVRSGNSLYRFVDGTQKGTTGDVTDKSISCTLGTIIAARDAGIGLYVNGWMEEIRISDVARWTSNFTPPTVPYGPATRRMFLVN